MDERFSLILWSEIRDKGKARLVGCWCWNTGREKLVQGGGCDTYQCTGGLPGREMKALVQVASMQGRDAVRSSICAYYTILSMHVHSIHSNANKT